MATIGNPTKYQSNPYYEATGNGVLVSFTLGWTPGTTASMVVSVGGVIQPPSSYTVVGNILTFTEAPPNGSVVLVNGLGVKAMTTLAEANVVGKDAPTGAAMLPAGSTAQRPTSPVNGYMRYNTDLLAMEAYVNGAWGSVGGSDNVKLTGNQTIAGVKTFSSSPLVPQATTSGQPMTYDQAFGVGQTLRVVTGSRVAGSTYTNTSGKLMIVMVAGTNSAANTICGFSIDGGVVLFSGVGVNLANGATACIGLVPAGSTYKLQADIGTISLISWTEYTV